MRSLLQAIHAREINGILIQILQHIRDEQHRDDSPIHLAQDLLDLRGIDVETGIACRDVEGVIIVEMCGRGGGRDVVVV